MRYKDALEVGKGRGRRWGGGEGAEVKGPRRSVCGFGFFFFGGEEKGLRF